MSTSDKIKTTAKGLGGKAKEAVGSVTGDKELEYGGKLDQAAAGVQQRVHALRDAAGSLVDDVKRD